MLLQQLKVNISRQIISTLKRELVFVIDLPQIFNILIPVVTALRMYDDSIYDPLVIQLYTFLFSPIQMNPMLSV